MKIHPLGRVPALKLDDGSPLSENTAILPYLGKRFEMWPSDPVKEARALSHIGFFASAYIPPTPTSAGPSATRGQIRLPRHPGHGQERLHDYLKKIDAMYVGREWLSDTYSVLDPYAFVFFTWASGASCP